MLIEKSSLPYGLWPSPISAGLVSRRLRLDDVQWSADGKTIVWAEGRSAINVLVSAQPGAAERKELTDEQNPRGGVGYGGGIFEAARGAGQDLLLFANRDGRLYRRCLGFEKPTPISPVIGPNGAVASPALSPDGRWTLYVFSDGATDLLAAADVTGMQWPVQFSRGADFYMQPAWHPTGEWAAWVEWNHPNMPWDGARVMLAQVQPVAESLPPRLVKTITVGGGNEIPAQQPAFSPDGHWLSFIEETEPTGEWPNLVLYDLQTGKRKLLIQGDGFELASPAWVQGVRSYGWSCDSRQIFHLRYHGPETTLWVTEVDNGRSSKIDTAPYTWLSQVSVSPDSDRLALIASSSDQPDQVILIKNSGVEEVVTNSLPATYPPAGLPQSREISWPAPDGTTVYGLYCPPSNPNFAASGLPPAILHIHGGPTSIAPARFNPEAAYFTSRGYAFVFVNYRGSTGYGRTYRNALRRRWGEVDVEDAAGCARALGEQNLADVNRLVIMGGSAGGYTVLNSLIHHPGLFKAGICSYGVANLFTLDMDTHKFEAHYNHTMIGPLPEAADRYYAWSPVFHAESIRTPLYIFQGSEDKVVPPSQSEEIVAVLRSRGIPHQYKLYEGEGHGFRRSETIADYLSETERFLKQHVLFAR